MAFLLASTAFGQLGTIKRVSISSGGEQGDRPSHYQAISGDGMFIAFYSAATNLVPNDTNGVFDAFVRDTVLGITERVSVSTSGQEANGPCDLSGIRMTPNGRYVAFISKASNLVSNDTNGTYDVFLRDRQLGTTERVSVSSTGDQGNLLSGYYSIGLSDDARFVAFESDATIFVANDTNQHADIFVRDRQMGTTELISISITGGPGNSFSNNPRISSDGRFVLFDSNAKDLVQSDTNGFDDAFVRDRQLGTTELVSLSSLGLQANNLSYSGGMSADGRFASFWSRASNLVPGDSNQRDDIFVRDRLMGTTERVSVSSTGIQGDNNSLYGTLEMNGDGRYVVFASMATNFVTGGTNGTSVDVFVRDRTLGITAHASFSTVWEEGTGFSPVISRDGRFVAFHTYTSLIVPNDTNNVDDVFVCEWTPLRTISGLITFDQVSPNWTFPTKLGMRVKFNGATVADIRLVTIATNHRYTIHAPPGDLEISSKHLHWLRITHALDTRGGDILSANYLFVNGDATDDNAVDLRDLNEVLLTSDSSDLMGDLDGDMAVTGADIAIVLLRFRQTGDP